MYLRRELLVSALLVGPLLAEAAADPLDCNRMAPVVSGIFVDQMQITRYLILDTAPAADAAFQLNYFLTERREYHRVFCSAVIKFSPSALPKRSGSPWLWMRRRPSIGWPGSLQQGSRGTPTFRVA
jgi:hypothetical protein